MSVDGKCILELKDKLYSEGLDLSVESLHPTRSIPDVIEFRFTVFPFHTLLSLNNTPYSPHSMGRRTPSLDLAIKLNQFPLQIIELERLR